MSRPLRPTTRRAAAGPSQRQLRAGELVRHALAEILRGGVPTEPLLSGAPVTVSEVRMSPDLRHALCFVEPLGGAQREAVVAALNRSAKYLRGRLGHAIVLRFTPDLKFVHDDSFDAAAHIDRLLSDARVRRDVEGTADDASGQA
jgi:ribosome-binding factor A